MICRHSKGDPNCGSSGGHVEYVYRDAPCTREHKSAGDIVETPDSKNYDIEQVEKVGTHLILKVKYPNCRKCTFEGNKVMVFASITELDVLRWKEIDPHFRALETSLDPMNRLPIKDPKKAPSPIARFPATIDGWDNAVQFAKLKAQHEQPGYRGTHE